MLTPSRIYATPIRVGFTLAIIFALSNTVLAEELSSSQPVQTIYEIRTRNIVLQQWDLSCAAATLATVLRYQHGFYVTEREVALGLVDRRAYYENPKLVRLRQGFSLHDMQRYVERFGYEGIGLGQMQFSDLVGLAPIIVPVDLHGFPHFVVFRGVLRNRVLLANPAFGNMTLSRSEFEKAWIEYDGTGRVGFIVQRDGEQAPARALAPTAREFVTFR